MPSLQIRTLPPDLYHALESEARNNKRSLAQQATYLLYRGIDKTENPRLRRAAVIERIRGRERKLESNSLPDLVTLIREDRER